MDIRLCDNSEGRVTAFGCLNGYVQVTVVNTDTKGEFNWIPGYGKMVTVENMLFDNSRLCKYDYEILSLCICDIFLSCKQFEMEIS